MLQELHPNTPPPPRGGAPLLQLNLPQSLMGTFKNHFLFLPNAIIQEEPRINKRSQQSPSEHEGSFRPDVWVKYASGQGSGVRGQPPQKLQLCSFF